MADPLHVPLSPFQASRFAQIRAEQDHMIQRSKELAVRHTEGLTIAIGMVCDPATVQDWHIEIVGNEIVCTPPTVPALVKEA